MTISRSIFRIFILVPVYRFAKTTIPNTLKSPYHNHRKLSNISKSPNQNGFIIHEYSLPYPNIRPGAEW